MGRQNQNLPPWRSYRRRYISRVIVVLTLVFSQTAAAGNPFKGLVDPEGQPVSLNDTYNNGLWTLVMVWATDCIPCTRQKPQVSAFYNKHKRETANVVGIAIDGRSEFQAVKAYLNQHQPTFPNYVANRKELLLALRRFGVKEHFPTPLYLLFDRNGNATNVSHAPFSIPAVESVIDQYDS